MNENQPIAIRRGLSFWRAGEWLIVAVTMVDIVLLILSYDLAFVRGDPSKGRLSGCYHTLELSPETSWIPPLQPYFSIGLFGLCILAASLISRYRNIQDSKIRNA